MNFNIGVMLMFLALAFMVVVGIFLLNCIKLNCTMLFLMFGVLAIFTLSLKNSSVSVFRDTTNNSKNYRDNKDDIRGYISESLKPN